MFLGENLLDQVSCVGVKLCVKEYFMKFYKRIFFKFSLFLLAVLLRNWLDTISIYKDMWWPKQSKSIYFVVILFYFWWSLSRIIKRRYTGCPKRGKKLNVNVSEMGRAFDNIFETWILHALKILKIPITCF